MGTRNLVEVVKDGQLKVAQYGQWDGYPTGQGVVIAQFIQKDMDKDKFKQALDNLAWATEEDDDARFKRMQQVFPDVSSEGWLTMEQAEWYRQNYPELSRDTGADILKLVQDSEGKLKLHNSEDFKNDGLFCEYYYRIDMDNETVTMNGTITLPFNEWTEEKNE